MKGDARILVVGSGAAALLAVGLLLLAGSGCSDSTSPGLICTGEWVPGITVEVVDGATGHPAACGSTVWIIEGDYAEIAESYCIEGVPESLQDPYARGAWERPGTYTVLVIREGFSPWSRTEIEVGSDRCHVEQVALEAVLERLPER